MNKMFVGPCTNKISYSYYTVKKICLKLNALVLEVFMYKLIL